MLDSKPYNLSKVWKRALTSSLSFFIFGYSIGIFTSSQFCIASALQWGSNSELLIAINSSLIPFGAVLGSIIAGFLSHNHGKRHNLIRIDILIILATLLTCYPNTISFLIGRFISGVAVGSISMLASGYTSEFTPKEVAAKMGSLSQLFIMSGITASNCVCLALPIENCSEDMKYYIFLIFLPPGLCALVQLLILLKVFKKESPFWLIKQKEYKLALASLESIYNNEYAKEELEKHLEKEKDNEGSVIQENLEPSYKELLTCKSGTTKAMRLGTLIHVFQQLSGINAIVFYTSLIFLSFGKGEMFARILTAFSSGSRALAMVFFIPFIDKVSKKSVLVYGTALMGVCLLVLGLTDKTGIIPLFIFFIFFYFALFANSIGPITWIYSSLVMSDKGLAFAIATNWTVAGFLVLGFPFLINGIGLAYSFLIFAFLNIVGAIYFALDMVDSTGLSKQELRKLLSEMR